MSSARAPREGRVQVLIVGAGPVGLLAAVRLRQQGIDVRVIEQRAEFMTHTFPVVLHPQSLRLLNELGLAAALFWRGRSVSRLAVYTEYERRAVLEMPKVKDVTPGIVTLPQDVLRRVLTNSLEQLGVAIEWNKRLAVLAQDNCSAWGRLVQQDSARGAQSGGLSVESFDADYVIGADGYESTVREALAIRLTDHGSLTSYVFFDAATARSGREAQLALSEEFSNAMYPLKDGMARFTFQMSRALDRTPDLNLLRELVRLRMPWFSSEIEHSPWSGVAEFRRALAERFGHGRVWLAGEAAHLTGPLGVQSLNVGLDEANELALHIVDAIKHPSRQAFGRDYDTKRSTQWRELLGIEERAVLSSRSPDWARRNLRRLVACLPASEADLDDLLEQLRVTPTSSNAERATT
jgi:2-polyprenyl-6-methoxyphenol hydroxylase-like FAD-dependent oxidoreductase